MVRTPLGVILRMLPAEPDKQIVRAVNSQTAWTYPRKWCFAARSG